MSNESRIEVINPDGWRKEFSLRRAIAYVGSQPGSDIVLPGADVAPRHLQFVPSPANPASYRIINLNSSDLTATLRGAPQVLAPRGALELADGDSVTLAGYTLQFRSGEVQSESIQARIELPATTLTLDKPLEGGIFIRNAGERAGVQFTIEIQGLDAHAVQIDPGPVLFPGVEKRLGFRLMHPRSARPAAGEHTITFVVSAPEGYPGETVVINQRLTIAPFYAHRVRFIPVEQGMGGFALK
jgi:hypothetical protein